MINFRTAEQAFEFYFKQIMREGKDRSGTKTMFNQSMKILFPNENQIKTPWRRWSEEYAGLEYEWYKSANPNPEMVSKAKMWNEIKDEDGLVNSNYGVFWKKFGQLEHIKKLLRDDLHTRRAVIVHYDVHDIGGYTKDTPCNLVLNFYIDEGWLHLTVFARSIDLVYGFCNDQYCLSRLLIDVADELGFDLGHLNYFITNLHIYEKHYYINERS
jgi:thymidylate synthase